GQELEEHVREAEQRIRGEALGRGQLLREGEEGAVREVVAVDEEQLRVARGAVVQLQLGSGECLRHTFQRYRPPPDAGRRDSTIFRGAVGRGGGAARRAPPASPGGRATAARALRGPGRRARGTGGTLAPRRDGFGVLSRRPPGRL